MYLYLDFILYYSPVGRVRVLFWHCQSQSTRGHKTKQNNQIQSSNYALVILMMATIKLLFKFGEIPILIYI